MTAEALRKLGSKITGDLYKPAPILSFGGSQFVLGLLEVRHSTLYTVSKFMSYRSMQSEMLMDYVQSERHFHTKSCGNDSLIRQSFITCTTDIKHQRDDRLEWIIVRSLPFHCRKAVNEIPIPESGLSSLSSTGPIQTVNFGFIYRLLGAE